MKIIKEAILLAGFSFAAPGSKARVKAFEKLVDLEKTIPDGKCPSLTNVFEGLEKKIRETQHHAGKLSLATRRQAVERERAALSDVMVECRPVGSSAHIIRSRFDAISKEMSYQFTPEPIAYFRAFRLRREGSANRIRGRHI